MTAELDGATLRKLDGAVGSGRRDGTGYETARGLDGDAEAGLEGDVSPRDLAPGGVSFEEAGARGTDLEGRRGGPTRSALAAAPALGDERPRLRHHPGAGA